MTPGQKRLTLAQLPIQNPGLALVARSLRKGQAKNNRNPANKPNSNVLAEVLLCEIALTYLALLLPRPLRKIEL
jgi:hypothetical protein